MFHWFYEPSEKGKGWSTIFLILYVVLFLSFLIHITIQLYLYGDWKHTQKIQGKVVRIYNCKNDLITNPIEKLYISLQNIIRDIDGDTLLSETSRSCAVEITYQIKKQIYTSTGSMNQSLPKPGDIITLAYDPNNVNDISLNERIIFDSTFEYTLLVFILLGCFFLSFFYLQNF